MSFQLLFFKFKTDILEKSVSILGAVQEQKYQPNSKVVTVRDEERQMYAFFKEQQNLKSALLYNALSLDPKINSISMQDYNNYIQGVFDVFSKDPNFEDVHITTDLELAIQQMKNGEAYELLKIFYDSANHSSMLSNPNDLNRWYDFQIAAFTQDIDSVQFRLVASDFGIDENSINDLEKSFENIQSFMSYLKSNGKFL